MLRLLFPPEPYSDITLAPTWLPNSDPFVADSAAARLLREQLLRYCKGEINGRSFLIGAARGGGKTTLVRSVVQRVERGDTGNTMLRPLLISLHGPDLWKQTSRLKEDSLKETVTTDSEKDGVKTKVVGERYPIQERDPSEVLLDQIILRTHRAFVSKLSRHYRDHVNEQINASLSLSEAKHNELFERGAQLPLSLFQDHPSPAELRSYWSALPRALVDGITPSNFAWRRGAKGVNELLALSGIVDAYRRISGKFVRTETQSSSSTLDSQSSVSGKSILSEWMPALLGVGAAGTAGVLTQNFGTPLSALIAAFAGLLTLGFSQTRQQKKSYSVDDSFIPDTSSQTLKRVVPIMFNWLREAGYAPVILIDELDKIGFGEDKKESSENMLTKYIDDIASQLKDLVAERAIFCFLVNRGQFAVIDEAIKSDPVGLASSFFSYRLMHFITPTEWSHYLNEIISEEAVGQNTSGLIAKRRLQRLFAYQSRLQPLAMQRTLQEFSEGDSTNLLDGANFHELGNRRYTIPITIQVLIEFALSRPAFKLWLQRNPTYNQLAADSLYFVAHLWESDYVTWRDPRADALDKDKGLIPYLRGLGYHADDQTEANKALLTILCDWSGQIMEWMCAETILIDPDFLEWLQSQDREGYLRDTIKIGIPALDFKKGIFKRLFDNNGNARKDRDLENWHEQVEKIKNCQELLTQILKDFKWPVQDEPLDLLASDYRILDLAPTWESVQRAMRSLGKVPGRKLDSTNRESAQAVVDYVRMLDGATTLVWNVLVCAIIVVRYATYGYNKLANIQHALEIVSQALRLSERNSEEAKEPARNLVASFQKIFPGVRSMPIAMSEEATLEQILIELLATKEHLLAINLSDFPLDSDAIWHAILSRTADTLLLTGSSFESIIDPGAAEVLWAAFNEGPFKYGLQLDPRTMNLAAWSQMLLSLSSLPVDINSANLRSIVLHALGLRLPVKDRPSVLKGLGDTSTNNKGAIKSFIADYRLWNGSIACIVLISTLERRSAFSGFESDSRAAILIVPESQRLMAESILKRLGAHTDLPCFVVREYDVKSINIEALDNANVESRAVGISQFPAFSSWPSTLSLPPNALVGIKNSRDMIDKLLLMSSK